MDNIFDGANLRIIDFDLIPDNKGYLFHPDIIRKFLKYDEIGKKNQYTIQAISLNRLLKYTENLEKDVINPFLTFILKSDSIYSAENSEEKKKIKEFIYEEVVHAELASSIRRKVSPLIPDKYFEDTNPKETVNDLYKKWKDKNFTFEDVSFAFVFSSETLISQRLNLNCSEVINFNVKNYMKMHLSEEIRHRKYFLDKFYSVFSKIEISKRKDLLILIAECIREFLKWDDNIIKLDLASMGESPSKSIPSENLYKDKEYLVSQCITIVSSFKNRLNHELFELFYDNLTGG